MAQSNFEKLWEAVGDAVADIRHKVVEEPMYGRAVTEDAAPQWPEARTEAPALGSATYERERAPEPDIER